MVWLRRVNTSVPPPPPSPPAPGLLSMSAGDFAEVYRQPDAAASFDAAAFCFFLDTAHNVIEYLEVAWHVLKVRGRGGGHCNNRRCVVGVCVRVCVVCGGGGRRLVEGYHQLESWCCMLMCACYPLSGNMHRAHPPLPAPPPPRSRAASWSTWARCCTTGPTRTATCRGRSCRWS
jgi:hypothetical protein